MASWQKDEFNNLLSSLLLNQVICVHDFSENYICRSQYFYPNKVSIHVTILYCPANLQTNAKESSEKNPSIIKEHIFALSDDNTQDYHFVRYVQDLILHYFREEKHLMVEKIHEMMAVLDSASLSTPLVTFFAVSPNFECQIDRHFFETSHAKGEQDAASANVKQ